MTLKKLHVQYIAIPVTPTPLENSKVSTPAKFAVNFTILGQTLICETLLHQEKRSWVF